MKTYNHLFEKMISYNNLSRAIDRSSLGKRDRREVKKILRNKNKYIKKIREMLLSGKFYIRDHEAKEIYDGISRKKRKIVQPDYIPEQIIHHAFIQVMSPIIMKSMYPYSCGSIPERGCHTVKNYIEKFMKKHPEDSKYCLKLDIHHFFQSINHNKLKALYSKYVKDDRMLDIAYKIIDSYHDHYDENGEPCGIAIGYYPSQWSGNWFLTGLDHFIKEKLGAKCYVRYMDDMVIFASSKEELHEMKDRIVEYLNDLGLEINNKWQIFKTEYIDPKDNKIKGRFLDIVGFRFHYNRVTLRRGLFYKSMRKANKLKKKKIINYHDAQQILSYVGWYKNTATKKVFEENISNVIDIKYMKELVSKHQRRLNKNGCKIQKCSRLSGKAA